MEKVSPPLAGISSASSLRRPWQAPLLAWLSLVAVLFLFLIVVLSAIFGYAGFKGGEMGTMIGIFAAVGLLFLLPLLVFSIAAVFGLFEGKRWALVLDDEAVKHLREARKDRESGNKDASVNLDSL